MPARRKGPTLIQRSRRVSPTEKALYHNELGAGRSRVIREFLGLSPEDETVIRTRLETLVKQRIGAQG